MLGHIFYHSLIRKYVVLFGTLFNDLKIVRTDTAHNITGTIDVPLNYGPREKVIARLQADPNLNKMPAIQMPRMAFELVNFQYDNVRKLHSTGRKSIGDGNDVKYSYQPVPYNLNFVLSIIVKNVDDAWRIVEQILPFFTPEFTIKANLISEFNEVRDIPVVLDSTNLTDLYEGNFEERRVMTVDLQFTMKAWLYGPLRTGGVITMANTNFFISDLSSLDDVAANSTNFTESFSVVPGQTANGQPTSNAAETIDRSLIAANSSYGFITTITTPLTIPVNINIPTNAPSLDFSIPNNSMYFWIF